jgi:hypothetical protein
MAGHKYLAFGLRIASKRPIPALAMREHSFAGAPDVEIREGEVPVPDKLDNIDGIKVNVQGDRYFLDIEECGRFQVTGGREIVVEPDPRATPEQVNLFLLGSVLGTLLHQRGILPFHCNAVEVDGVAFLFCGDSGAGKSTLAAHFVDRGFRLLTDDLCALHFPPDGGILAAPGIARLKLWQDTLKQFGRSATGLKLVPWYDDKFELALTGERLEEPLEVAGLYHLRVAENGHSPGIHRLRGIKAANAVTANIYRRRLADLAGAAPFYLTATARMIEQVPIFTMNRHWGFAHFREDAIAVEHHMRQLLRKGTRHRDESSDLTQSEAPLRG